MTAKSARIGTASQPALSVFMATSPISRHNKGQLRCQRDRIRDDVILFSNNNLKNGHPYVDTEETGWNSPLGGFPPPLACYSANRGFCENWRQSALRRLRGFVRNANLFQSVAQGIPGKTEHTSG